MVVLFELLKLLKGFQEQLLDAHSSELLPTAELTYDFLQHRFVFIIATCHLAEQIVLLRQFLSRHVPSFLFRTES